AYSRDFVAYSGGDWLLRHAIECGESDGGHFMVVVLVDSVPPTDLMPPRSIIDITGIEEDRALDLVASKLSLDLTESAQGSRWDRGSDLRSPRIATSHWNVQLTRNTRFVGRGDLLEQVRDLLRAAGPDGGRLALTGLPGVGKTQIALEYAYRFA